MSLFARPRSDDIIRITTGDSLEVVFNFVNEGGNPVDFTDWTPLAKARGNSSGNITDLTVTKGESKVTMSITPEVTTSMEPFSTFDIQFTKSGDAERVTPVAGIIQLLPEVTI